MVPRVIGVHTLSDIILEQTKARQTQRKLLEDLLDWMISLPTDDQLDAPTPKGTVGRSLIPEIQRCLASKYLRVEEE